MEIVIIDSGYKSYDFEKELFQKHGFQLKIYPLYKGDRNQKMQFAQNAVGLLVRHTEVNDEFLSKCKNLKAIVRYGVGFDNIDVNACSRFGVKVANVQGYANHSVSDHALAMLLACSRGMWNTTNQLLNKFAAPPVDDVFELHDKTLGIIGLGRIGSELAKKTKPLFKEIIATDPYKTEEHFKALQVKKLDLEEVLKKSHVISLHCNLTNETNQIINTAAFKKMENCPIIINTSRGETIDEKALLDALNQKIIHSAALDVFANEPTTTKQEELIKHERTICTGHYAWYSDRAAQELQKRAAKNLLNLLRGIHIEDSLN